MANTPEIDLKLPSTADNIAEQINIDAVNNLTKIDNAIKNDRQLINSLEGGEVYQATLLNGWTNSTSVGVRYRKNGLGLVIVEISVKPNSTISTTNSKFAELPLSYRPSINISVPYHDNARGVTYSGIAIYTNGEINITKPARDEILADGIVNAIIVFKAVD